MKKLISSALIATMLVTQLVSSTSFANEVKESKTHYAQDEKSFDSQKTGKIVACVAAGALTLTGTAVAISKQIKDKLPKPIQEKLSFFNNKKEQEESQSKVENENTLNLESTFENNSTTDIKPVIQEKKNLHNFTASNPSSTKKTPVVNTTKPTTHSTKEMNNTNPVTAGITINSVNIINKEDDDDLDDIDKINNLKNVQKSSSGPIANLWAQIQAPVISAFASFVTFCLLKFISRGQEVVAANSNPSQPQYAIFEKPTFALLSKEPISIPFTILKNLRNLSIKDIRIQLLQLYPNLREDLLKAAAQVIKDLPESDWDKIIPKSIPQPLRRSSHRNSHKNK